MINIYSSGTEYILLGAVFCFEDLVSLAGSWKVTFLSTELPLGALCCFGGVVIPDGSSMVLT